MKKLMAFVLAGIAFSGCTCGAIQEGNFGLKQSFVTSAYDHSPYHSGFNLVWFGDIQEFNGREILLQVDDIHPKDKSNILLKDLDLVVVYTVNKEKAADFLVRTSDSKNGNMGVSRVERAARQMIGPSVRHFESIEILNDPTKLQDQFKTDIQKSLDEDYGAGTFQIVDVKVANILVNDVIESRIQSAAILAAEKAKNEATLAVIESRQTSMDKEATVLKHAADTAGITVDQLLQAELIKAIRDGAKVEPIVNLKK
jgi:regulator of protease activity HflC (stomatin/prohibitin superfamily)